MSAVANTKAVSSFVWYELHSADMPASIAFYTKVFPWSVVDAGMPDSHYNLISAGPHVVGGAMATPAQSVLGTKHQGWLGYVGVSGIDQYASRIEAAGGKILRAVEDIATVGKFAVAADPQGAYFTLFEPLPMADQPLPAPATPGTFAWHDLTASEWQSDFDFYSNMFGWEKGEAIPMGDAGIYQIFTINGEAAGGMMTRMDPSEAPGWLYYINVADTAATCEIVKANGGVVTHGPSEVPGGQIIAHFTDPHGSKIGIVSPPK
jgi:predicted enzyme related to lactoylglutathione lyase